MRPVSRVRVCPQSASVAALRSLFADNPDFAKALAGIWYETVGLMAQDTPEGAAARAAMGAASGTDQAGFEAQLAATLQQDHAVPTRKGERQAALGRLFEQRGDFVYIEFGHRPDPPAIRSDPTSLRSKHSNRVQPA